MIVNNKVLYDKKMFEIELLKLRYITVQIFKIVARSLINSFVRYCSSRLLVLFNSFGRKWFEEFSIVITLFGHPFEVVA